MREDREGKDKSIEDNNDLSQDLKMDSESTGLPGNQRQVM
jgi:hypothetical protein